MFRQAVSSDLPGIIALWQEAFGDTEAWIRDFFRSFPACISYVCEEEGRIVSMAHALPQLLSPDTLAVYLYAAATVSDRRGEGLFSRLEAFLEEDLRRRGIQCAVLVPAEPSLFSFYGRLGYEAVFTRRRTPFPGGKPISQEEYLSLREHLLTGPHMVCDPRTLDYVRRTYGLTFYRTETGIAARSPACTAEVLPEDLGGQPHAMLKWLTNSRPISGGYLGFPLD